MKVSQTAEFFANGFAFRRAMAILRGFSPEETLALANAAWNADLAMVEVPLQDQTSTKALKTCVDAAEQRNAIVGAGTITSVELVKQAAVLGAQFTVAPGFDPEVASSSLAHGMPHLPGVATATEIQRATSAGFSWLKAFPAGALGADWITAMHGPFPRARFVATGGITAKNAKDFLAGGADAVSFGAAFADLSAEELENLGKGLL